MSCNACLSRFSAFNCWLSWWIVLWIAWRQLAWCSRGEDKLAENSGVGWWTAEFGLDRLVGWRGGRKRVPSVMCWLIEGAWSGLICGGIPQNNWAKGKLMVVELPSNVAGSQEDWNWGRKAGARGFSDISGEMQWSPVEELPIVEKGEMCFELCILGVGYPKKLFPIWRIRVWDCIVNSDQSGVFLFCVCDLYNIHGDVGVQEQNDQVEVWGD